MPIKFESLFTRYKGQNPKTAFAFFRYPPVETWEKPFEELARLAKPEQWGFERSEFKEQKYSNQRFPILTSYLNYTFLRVQELGLIAYSEDEDKACFNTGLLTAEEKEIFATFFANKQCEDKKQSPWTFYTFAESYSFKLESFPNRPKINSYITDPSALVFDTNLELDVNYEHIIKENSDRLPIQIQDNPRLALTSIKGAVESLRDKVARNYKLAIPHWYENRIQLLLPLHLTSDIQADLALVVDKDKSRGMYLARTVLTMDMAYIDARLITRPDRDWLNP
ncbi:MAG: DUF3825 domain-containing protein [Nostoc sp.]|uniref:DUF3825 domain-containing protein n=1 Tax=Nostoc sp. TaxID=1180 RepID=UPI002FF97284